MDQSKIRRILLSRDAIIGLNTLTYIRLTIKSQQGNQFFE